MDPLFNYSTQEILCCRFLPAFSSLGSVHRGDSCFKGLFFLIMLIQQALLYAFYYDINDKIIYFVPKDFSSCTQADSGLEDKRKEHR